MYGATLGSVVDDAVVRSCLAAGFYPHRAYEVTETSAALALVAAGLGVAVLPDSIRSAPREGVRVQGDRGRAAVTPRPRLARGRHLAAAAESLKVLERNDVFLEGDPEGSGMKIAKVEAIPFAIPYRKPLRFASGEVHAAEHVLVRVHTDDGLVGTADAPPRPFTYGETQDVDRRGRSSEHLRARDRRSHRPGTRGRPRSARTAPSPTRSPRRPSTWRCGTSSASRWACR